MSFAGFFSLIQPFLIKFLFAYNSPFIILQLSTANEKDNRKWKPTHIQKCPISLLLFVYCQLYTAMNYALMSQWTFQKKALSTRLCNNIDFSETSKRFEKVTNYLKNITIQATTSAKGLSVISSSVLCLSF